MFLSLFIVFITSLFVWDYLVKKRRCDILHDMPGPKPLPILGNLLLYSGQSPEDILKLLQSNRIKYGELYKVWMFQRLSIFSSNPKDIEVILSSSQYITKNNFYDMFRCWLGNGLLTSTGNVWHARRKIITPTFHFKILEHFVKIFDEQSTIMIDKFYAKADGATAFDIYPYVSLVTLDIIAETAMGTKINAQINPDIPHVKAVSNITRITAERYLNAWQRNDFIFRLIAPQKAKRHARAVNLTHEFTEKIIIERRKTLECTNNKSNESVEKDDMQNIRAKQRLAFLDVLLQSRIDGQSLSIEEIRQEVDTFMFGGHDTMLIGISMCLFMIARHPDVQKKIVEELHSVIGDDKDRSISLQILNNLKYLECVIKETLRLYPPVPLIGRYIENDVEINGRTIPAGANYVINMYVMMRDPKYFPEPEIFKPERFISDTLYGEKIHSYSYIPFSAGPRNCIGQKFAMLEMKSTISKVLRHFEVLPLGQEVRPMWSIILRSLNGVHVGFKIRLT